MVLAKVLWSACSACAAPRWAPTAHCGRGRATVLRHHRNVDFPGLRVLATGMGAGAGTPDDFDENVIPGSLALTAASDERSTTSGPRHRRWRPTMPALRVKMITE